MYFVFEKWITVFGSSSQASTGEVADLDSTELAARLLPMLMIEKKQSNIRGALGMFQPSTRLGSTVMAVAKACATEVHTPHDGKCCGMGGDRGFELPGLALSATADVGHKMSESHCDVGFTNARSCAISLNSGTGRPWRSIFHLLDECTPS